MDKPHSEAEDSEANEHAHRSLDGVREKFRSGWNKGGARVSKMKGQATDAVKEATHCVSNSATKLGTYLPASLAFLSQTNLLKWSEQMTKGAASAYDKALDATYLKTHIGGYNHRMFDGGHSPLGAFDAARGALPDDTFIQETLGYMSALWKDLSTVKGLPFFTWDQDAYGNCAEWVTTHVPGANKAWFYDMCSYDAFELLGAALPVVSVIFALRSEDQAKVAEILGASGFVSIAAANPLAAIAMICVAAYAYAVKRQEFDGGSFVKGAGMAGLSFTLFAVLGFPILIEFIIVLVITHLIRHRLPKPAIVRKFIVMRVMPTVTDAKSSIQRLIKNNETVITKQDPTYSVNKLDCLE